MGSKLMKELVQITIDKELRSNPKLLANMIVQLSTEINECRNNLTELKERDFWKRTFSNNTRDLADAMIKQNDTISTFINIVQVLIGFNLHNAVVLGGIVQELSKVSGNISLTENEYFNLAKDYISETFTAAQKTNKKFDEFGNSINSINNELVEKKQIDDEQTKILNLLKQKYEEKEKLDEFQTKEIENLKKSKVEKDLLDKQQNDELDILQKAKIEKDNLDNEQNNKINQLSNEILQLKEIIESLTNKKISELDNKLINFSGSLSENNLKLCEFENIANKVNSKYKNLLLISFIYIILSFISFIYLFIK